jgi:hypothetical protein
MMMEPTTTRKMECSCENFEQSGVTAKRRSGKHHRGNGTSSFLTIPLLLVVAVLLVDFAGIMTLCSAEVPRPRKALLFKTLRQAQIDPSVLAEENNVLGEALNKNILHNPDAPIDLLSICRLQCRLEEEIIENFSAVERAANDNDDSSDIGNGNGNGDLQRQCTVEMFELTQASGVAPPNVTLAFGSDTHAKSRDFIAWCHRLLTSRYFEDDPQKLEDFRRQMVISNPYWKAAVKATYLTMMILMENDDEVEEGLLFEEIIKDPKQWSVAIQSLREQKTL